MTKLEIENYINNQIKSLEERITVDKESKLKNLNYDILKEQLEEYRKLKSVLPEYDIAPEFYQKYFEIRLEELNSPII